MWVPWDPLDPQDLVARLDPTVLMARKAPPEVLGTWVPPERRGSQENQGLQGSWVSQVSRVPVGSVGRKERRGRRERPGHPALKAPQATMGPRATLVLLVSLVTPGPLEKSALGARMVPRVTEERTENPGSPDPLDPLGRMDHPDRLGSAVLPARLARRGGRERRAPREIPVWWVPQGRQALWVLLARQENLALTG